MKVTLQVNGQEMTFSKKELISILEEYFKIKDVMQKQKEIAPVPTEGKWFDVNPLAIDQNLFKEEMDDPRQEATRQLILEAFEEVKKDSKYARPFKTLMPEKNWNKKTLKELKELGSTLGDHIADWVEQVLEWAQRIANGETWENICNMPDNANLYRLVIWKSGGLRVVGGSREYGNDLPASDFDSYDSEFGHAIGDTVPLVVSYN